jgi:hypothetical protein
MMIRASEPPMKHRLFQRMSAIGAFCSMSNYDRNI